ncbi:HNH endonuclease [Aeromicrobium sp. SMF47]|uniref:HNH endonuclease n=1 Tax=Aeromicrobium yanjiei TaxID=2662028 RepID=A0A5Q2MP82_9ACTN|nr:MULTISPECIES: HNH endonuclease [Aeromicrobium]MRJ75680.1 HNH endonuclease [Aeromicrobium yanjiei]MRK00025.1 HNH endonuclease [Aeromicrobium sp. S22]QGG43062.1 HNH endonuclease [Aeromicrobium yanjiei]
MADAYVLVLNASYEPLQRVSMRHAIKMLVREVAVIEEEAGGTFGPFPVPKVLRLVRYVVTRWMHRRGSMCTKSAIKARDKMCAYCGGQAETVDHIVPRSRGGTLTWDNAVAACLRCNHRKADRTPSEAGMSLLVVPTEPRYTVAR